MFGNLSAAQAVSLLTGMDLAVAERCEALSKAYHAAHGPADSEQAYRDKLDAIAAGVGADAARFWVLQEVVIALGDDEVVYESTCELIDDWHAGKAAQPC